MVRWLRWHCPPDIGFEIRALAVWGRARYLSVTEAPRNTDFHTWMGKKHFCFFQTAESGNRTPNSGVKGSGANHYPSPPPRPSRQKEARSPDCAILLWIIYSAQYHRQHSTLQAFEHFGPLYIHNPNDKHQTRPNEQSVAAVENMIRLVFGIPKYFQRPQSTWAGQAINLLNYKELNFLRIVLSCTM